MSEVGVVTVGERPSRIVVAAAGLLVAAVVPGSSQLAAGAAAAATLGLCLAGLAQLLLLLRRQLGPPAV